MSTYGFASAAVGPGRMPSVVPPPTSRPGRRPPSRRRARRRPRPPRASASSRPDRLGGARLLWPRPRPGRPPPRRRGRSGARDRRPAPGSSRSRPTGSASAPRLARATRRGRSAAHARRRSGPGGSGAGAEPARRRCSGSSASAIRAAASTAARRSSSSEPPSASQRPDAVPRPLPAIAGGSLRARETTIRNASAPRPSATPRSGLEPGQARPRATANSGDRAERQRGEHQVEHLEGGERRNAIPPVENQADEQQHGAREAGQGAERDAPLGERLAHFTTKFTSFPGTTIVFDDLPAVQPRGQPLGAAGDLLELARAGRRPATAIRSISLPFTCTISWTSSVASSAGSATGHGCSQTRSPVITLVDLAPRCGANGKISEPAVAIAKRSCDGRRVPLARSVDLVDKLDHRGDRRVDGEPLPRSRVTLSIAQWALRSSAPSARPTGSVARLGRVLGAARHRRDRKRWTPATPSSHQSRALAGWPRKRM